MVTISGFLRAESLHMHQKQWSICLFACPHAKTYAYFQSVVGGQNFRQAVQTHSGSFVFDLCIKWTNAKIGHSYHRDFTAFTEMMSLRACRPYLAAHRRQVPHTADDGPATHHSEQIIHHPKLTAVPEGVPKPRVILQKDKDTNKIQCDPYHNADERKNIIS